jgi:photosystem II stability/assembly factor-like uncharacterized protein
VQVFDGNPMRSTNYIVATSDGGRTWQPMRDFPSGSSYTVAFLDTNNFWALISDGKAQRALYQTSDGGQTWALLTWDVPQGYQGNPLLMFIDQRTGFMFEPSQQFGKAPSTWLVTSDGGRTWKEVHPQIS